MAFLVDLAPAAGAVTDVVTGLSLPSVDIGKLLPGLFVVAALLIGWRIITRHFKSQFLEQITSNWRLALLGATGVVLSLASGWTTWDGMRNFTQEPVLSLMITFGIQGVMLIVAWLIGESFATGMTQRQAAPVAAGAAGQTSRRGFGAVPQVMGMAIGILIAAGLAILVLDAFDVSNSEVSRASPVPGLSVNMVLAALVVLIAIGVVIAAGTEILGDYKQGLKVVVRSSVLWVMFLACMATSVFFSFDSLFSTIFPQQERERAAALRAQNQVAGVVNDIGAIAVQRRIRETEALFDNAGWKRFDGELNKVVELAKKSPDLMRAEIERQLRERQSRIAALQERRANAEGSQASLVARKARLNAELERAQADRPEAAARVNEFKGVVAEIERRLDEAKAAMLAEERGVEGSGKAGRGPMWREARANVTRVQAELEVAQRRLSGHTSRLESIDSTISRGREALAQIDSDLAKLKGEVATTEQLISVGNTEPADDSTRGFDPADSVAQLETSRRNFQLEPTANKLTQQQNICAEIKASALAVPALATDARAVNCDGTEAAEAASLVFALNVGIRQLEQNCIGGDKLPQSGGADALFSFARKCVQDARLPSDATDVLRTRINVIELNRDDKAHRFVVTTNAFQDGNKLAYLALAIAIAIDSLVFMSGLFGANAVRSPLTDVPSDRPMSANQLETIIDGALRQTPSPLQTIQALIHAQEPLSYPQNGFVTRVRLSGHRPLEKDMRTVLNAGASIQAVRAASGEYRAQGGVDEYWVQRGLNQYLYVAAEKTWNANRALLDETRVFESVATALAPNHHENISTILGHVHFEDEREGFVGRISLGELDKQESVLVKRLIAAGLGLGVVRNSSTGGRRLGSEKVYTNEFYFHERVFAAFNQIQSMPAAEIRREMSTATTEAVPAASSAVPGPIAAAPTPPSVAEPNSVPTPMPAQPAPAAEILTSEKAIRGFLEVLRVSEDEQYRLGSR
jgi:peptidoglycan hydrolase CwlO-like protein